MKHTENHQSGFGHIEILLLVVVVGVICAVGYVVFHAKSHTSVSTSATTSATNSKAAESSLQYDTIKSGARTSTSLSDYGGPSSDKGVFVYLSTTANLPGNLSLPQHCPFSLSNFGQLDSGVMIVQDALRNSGTSFTSLDQLAASLSSSSVKSSLVTLNGSKVLKLDVSTLASQGRQSSCSGRSGGAQVAKSYNIKAWYVVLTKSGKEIDEMLVSPDITVNNVSIDATARDKAASLFTDADVQQEISYILQHNN